MKNFNKKKNLIKWVLILCYFSFFSITNAKGSLGQIMTGLNNNCTKSDWSNSFNQSVATASAY